MTDAATPTPDLPSPDPDEIARAFDRLRELAGDLPLQADWSHAAFNVIPGGVHVSSDGAQLGGFRVKGKGNYVFTGDGVVMTSLHVVLDTSDSYVYIGPGVVGDHLTLVRVLNGRDNFVYIGARSDLDRVGMVVTGPDARVVIGEDCVLSPGIILTNSDGHSVYDVASGNAINPDANVTIGDHVFVGADVLINKGATIGRNSIVAAHSIVQTALPADGYHIGFPARCRRRGITWTRDEAAGAVTATSRARGAENS